MADLPLWSGGQATSVSLGGAGTLSTTVTAHASANTKGSYAQITAATTVEAHGIIVIINPTGTGAFLMDLAVGAAAAEVDIVSNLKVENYTAANNDSATVFWLPLHIPNGSRLAARCQAATGGAALTVGCVLTAAGPTQPVGFQRCTTYGAVTASSTGTAHTGGNAAKATRTELTASTTNPIKMLFVAVGNNANSARGANRTFSFDVSVGGAGSEVDVLSNLHVQANSSEQVYPNWYGPFAVDIPASTRLSVRAACSGATAGDLDYLIYGLD